MLNSFLDKFIFTSALKYRHNNFFLVNMPFVILPIDMITEIAKKENKDLNLDLYYSVKEGIKKRLKTDFEKDFGVRGEKGLEFMETFFTASGWGKLERNDLDFEKKYAIVNVTNSPVANECPKCELPVDTFLRGVIAGIFSIYFDTDVDCVEIKCSAQNQKSCEFIVKPLHEFNFENKITRMQLRVE